MYKYHTWMKRYLRVNYLKQLGRNLKKALTMMRNMKIKSAVMYKSSYFMQSEAMKIFNLFIATSRF